MGLESNNTEDTLIGFGLSGVLVFTIVLGVELYSSPPPNITSLQPFSGQLVEQRISQDKSRIFAEIQVKNSTQNIILFQQVSKKLSFDIQKLPPGKTVTALIFPKDFIDHRTGLIRHSMWQLATNEQELFSYENIVQLINYQTSNWRVFAYWSGAIGVICLIIAALRRLSHF